MRISEYYDMAIYSDSARFVGEVQEVVLDLDEGTVLGLGIGRKGEGVTTIPYESVMAIGDIILVKSVKGMEKSRERSES